MDYLSDSSGQNDNPDLADIQRLHAAWKNVKQKRQSDKKSVNSVKNAIHVEQQKNLQARLAMTEKQLAKARQNTTLLMKKLSEAQQMLEIKQFQQGKQRKLRQQKEIQIEQLKTLLQKRQVYGDGGQRKELNEYSKNQTESLKKKLQLKQKQVDRLCLKIKSLQLDKQSSMNQFKKLSQINQNLRKQLSQSENAMNQAYLNNYSKGAQLLSLNQSQKTIQRLIMLLRGTQEYKMFGQFAEEAEHIHFLSNIPKRLKNNNLVYRMPDRKKICSCMDIKIDERLLWTPQSCYRTMLNMKIKYNQLNQDCIEQVLFQLNKIWASKQEARVRKVKQYYEGQILKLKKKNQIRYDEMIARKQIQRLKKQLSGAKNIKKQSKGASMQNLKNLGQYQDQVRVKNRQIKLLLQRIKLLQTQSSSNDKILYLEGALWIIQKVLSQMDVNQEDIRTYESQFRQKITNNLCTQDWIRSFKEFFETITEINNGLIQRLMSMRQSTLKKISCGNEGILGNRNE